MLDRRAIALTREIRDFYARSCALADRYGAGWDAEYRALARACRARPSTIRELNYFEDVFDRHAAVRTALADKRIRARSTVLHGAFWLVMFGLCWQMRQVPGAGTAALIAAVPLVGLTLFAQQRLIVGGALFRRILREQLIARGVPLCLHCGYDLRGQVEPRCPECGQAAASVPTVARAGGACHVV